MRFFSAQANNKLETFCASINQGIRHPLDENRWFSFICQTVDDRQALDADTLSEILHDMLDEDYIPKLVSEYELACRLLQYYKETHE